MNSKLTLPILGSAFFSGVLFAIGLVIGGMTHPSKIFGFLDFFGDWDPSLAFVMAGAIGVNAPLTILIRRKQAPLLQSGFSLPVFTAPWRSQLTAPLLVGAALFGAGWGLGGYCPGPAIVSVSTALSGSGATSALVFTTAMIAGMVLFSVYDRYRTPKAAPTGKACCAPESNRGTFSGADGVQSSAAP